METMTVTLEMMYQGQTGIPTVSATATGKNSQTVISKRSVTAIGKNCVTSTGKNSVTPTGKNSVTTTGKNDLFLQFLNKRYLFYFRPAEGIFTGVKPGSLPGITTWCSCVQSRTPYCSPGYGIFVCERNSK